MSWISRGSERSDNIIMSSDMGDMLTKLSEGVEDRYYLAAVYMEYRSSWV